MLKEELDRLLEIESAGKSKLACTTSASGPGLLDTWAMIEEKADYWLNLTNTVSTEKRKKIILSDISLMNQCLTESDLNFFNALIQYYDVYLWPGNDIPFHQCVPIRSTQELADKRNKIQFATNDTIDKVMSRQGISVSEYSIIDLKRYDRINRKKSGGSFPSPDNNNAEFQPFRRFIAKLKNLQQHSFTPEEEEWMKELGNVTGLISDSLSNDEINIILNRFPNIEQVSCSALDNPVLKTNAKRVIISGHLGLKNTNPIIDTEITREVNIKSINCKFTDPLKVTAIRFQAGDTTHLSTIVEPCYNLELLDLQSSIDKKLNLTKFIKLHTLLLSHQTLTSGKLTFPQPSNIKKIEIASFPENSNLNDTIQKIKSACPLLEEIKIYHDENTTNNIDLSTLNHLRQLQLSLKLNKEKLGVIKVGENVENINIQITDHFFHDRRGMHPKEDIVFNMVGCRHLKCIQLHDFLIDSLEKFSHAELILLYSAKIKCPLDFSKMPNLTSIKLQRCQLMANEVLRIQSHAALEQISLSGSLSKAIEIENLEKLKLISINVTDPIKKIHIKNCKNLKEIKLEINSENFDPSKMLLIEGCDNLTLDKIKINMNVIPKNSVHLSQQEYQEHNNRITTDIANQCNPVTLFSLDTSDVSSDSNTAFDPKGTVSKGNISATILSSQPVSKNRYRIEVRDTIAINNGKILFKSNPSEKIPEPIKIDLLSSDLEERSNQIHFQQQCIDKDETEQLGALTIKNMKKGHFYPLPTHCNPNNLSLKALLSSNSNALQLHWDGKTQQFFVSLIKEFKPPSLPSVTLYYRIAQETTVNANSEPVKEQKPLLPIEITSQIKKLMAEQPKLSFISDEKLSLSKKIQFLYHYCNQENFKNEALDELKDDTSDILFSIIKQQKGACRHRSQAFMLLSHYLGVPSRMIYNELHAFCEVPYISQNNKTQWLQYDFGGAPTLDLTPLENRVNPIANALKKSDATIKNQKNDASQAMVISPEHKIKASPLVTHSVYQTFSELGEKNKVKSISSLLNTTYRRMPLIELAANQTPESVNSAIIAALREQKEDVIKTHIYIHTPRDFHYFLEPLSLDETAGIKRTQGPLEGLIKNGGILVVNWSTFSPKEIVSYKSILDDPPTLLGRQINPGLKIINLTTAKTPVCSAFLSRCMPLTVSNDALKTEQLLKSDDNQAIIVNLYGLPLWREALFGKITFKGKLMQRTESLLEKAIKENRPLKLLNPPENDPEFNELLYRLNTERKVQINGKQWNVSDKTNVIVEQEPVINENTLASIKILSVNEVKVEDQQPLYLGLHNWHECLSVTRFDGKGNANEEKGYLYTNHQFYITETLPPGIWKKIQNAIASDAALATKKFEFILAPNVQLGNLPPIPSQPLRTESVWVTNDPVCLCHTLLPQDDKSEVPLIVNMTPQMGISDLLVKTTITPGKNGFDFNLQEQGVLNALKNGKTVILSGDISPSVYQTLLPLLRPWTSDKKITLNLNGEPVTLPPTAKLIVVLPESAAKKLPLGKVNEKQFMKEDYYRLFPKEEKANIEKLASYFDYVGRLPLRGIGRPTNPPQLTYERIKMCLTALKDKYPTSNPIKSLLLYDYPKGSADFSYLNVLGKLYFTPTDKKPVRKIALRQLIKRFNIQSKQDVRDHAWQLLNCFQGKELKELLGDTLEKSIDFTQAFPTLHNNIIEILYEKINQRMELTVSPVLITTANDQTAHHRHKKARRLDMYLNDEHTKMIFLKGSQGTGKTYAVSTINTKTNTLYDGIANIKNWLQDTSKDNKIKVLLLDEANMAQPGTWDFLRGLAQNKIYYDGKFYDITAQHKVIFTGNPEHFPRRYYHQLIQQNTKNIYFDEWSRDEYKAILQSTLQQVKSPDIAIETILFAMEKLRKYNPFVTLSLRDLENIAIRFMMLSEEKHAVTNQAVIQACEVEFANMIPETNQRKSFMDSIKNHVLNHDKILIDMNETPLNSLITVRKNIVIPPQKKYIIDVIQQAIDIQAYAEKNKITSYKRGVLIEGDAGLGKSTLIKAVLENNGFVSQEKAKPTDKKYYEISAGEPDVYKILEKAFQEGAAVILDEINLDSQLETVLNQYLSGRGVDKPSAKPGFSVFASQNPGYFAGRDSLSPALLNRLSYAYMDNYTDQELMQLATRQQQVSPAIFVQCYREVQDTHPHVNSRTFFTVLNQLLEKQKPDAQIILTPKNAIHKKRDSQQDILDNEEKNTDYPFFSKPNTVNTTNPHQSTTPPPPTKRQKQ